jgi:hypothetical protein
MPSTGSSNASRLRRWLQFRLRTALLLFVAWAAVLAWYVHSSQRIVGRVRWVNRRTATVWIYPGKKDGLPPRTVFDVHSVDANSAISTRREGVIELTLVRGDHLAEAKVVEDDASDPIKPGDLVWTTNFVDRFPTPFGLAKPPAIPPDVDASRLPGP